MTDDITLRCPCCLADLTLDDAGDLKAIELPDLTEGEARGLGNLVVSTTGTKAAYTANQQIEGKKKKGGTKLPSFKHTRMLKDKEYKFPDDTAPVGYEETAARSDAPDADYEAILEANEQDLKHKNIF